MRTLHLVLSVFCFSFNVTVKKQVANKTKEKQIDFFSQSHISAERLAKIELGKQNNIVSLVGSPLILDLLFKAVAL